MIRRQETIRQALREATASAHAQLDTSTANRDLADPREYAEFLQLQFVSRVCIEAWVEECAPPALQCPSQTALIAADLVELGRPQPEIPHKTFSAPAAGALGVAWALGGSSLGNRAMLAGLRKREALLPVRFLADEAMPAFFSRLRRTIEQPGAGYADLPAAITAAHAVFARFIEADTALALKQAA